LRPTRGSASSHPARRLHSRRRSPAHRSLVRFRGTGPRSSRHGRVPHPQGAASWGAVSRPLGADSGCYGRELCGVAAKTSGEIPALDCRVAIPVCLDAAAAADNSNERRPIHDVCGNRASCRGEDGEPDVQIWRNPMRTALWAVGLALLFVPPAIARTFAAKPTAGQSRPGRRCRERGASSTHSNG